MKIHLMSESKIEMIAERLNPMVRGGMNSFGKFNKSVMKFTLECINSRLIKGAMCKYKRFRGRVHRAREWMREVAKREPNMFAHWTLQILP